MKITDHLVQLQMEGEWDNTVLNRPSFLVNMRLYRINTSYRHIILGIVQYMDEHLHTHFDDYPDPRGIAAANLGFPFRIIGYKKGTKENQFCINPELTYRSANTVTTQSNCGSIRLNCPVNVERHSYIDFNYYDLEGNLVLKKNIGRGEAGFTI